MTTPKQDITRLRLIEHCHYQIKAKGAPAKVILRMPGTQRKARTRRYSAKGPRGDIIAQTHDCRKILVMFKADELLTSLEVIRNDSTTG
jgi:hypothetical protein